LFPKLSKTILSKSAFSRESRYAVSSIGKRKKATTRLPGTVEKVIKPHPGSREPEKAQIAVEGADDLYRELRVPNKLTDDEGNKVKLVEGTEVEVKIEAEESSVDSHD
jgi:hypothetical protein